VQLQQVNVGNKALADYATIASRGLMEQIKALAEPLAGKRVLHLSATAFGGGVAEILYTLVPLMREAGLDTEWRVIQGQDEFFDVTKAIHNALQGNPRSLTDEEQEVYRRYNRRDMATRCYRRNMIELPCGLQTAVACRTGSAACEPRGVE